MIVRNCQECKKQFRTFASRIRIGKGKYCSKKCSHIALIGKPSLFRGVKLSKDRKERLNLKGLELGRGWNKGLKMGPNPEHSRRMKGRIPWNKGLKGFLKGHPPTSIKRGVDNSAWKGDNVGYVALHDWVKRYLGTPLNCVNCPRMGGSNRSYHWHNISGEYKRDLSDWIRLCSSCHRKTHNAGKKV